MSSGTAVSYARQLTHTTCLLWCMCRCRVLDACGLCVLPSGVAALTSLTKLCVPTRAAWRTPLKPQAAAGWSLIACSRTNLNPRCPVLTSAGGCLTMACVSCRRRLGACPPWSLCESTHVLEWQLTQLRIAATSCILHQPLTALLVEHQHPGINMQQPGKRVACCQDAQISPQKCCVNSSKALYALHPLFCYCQGGSAPTCCRRCLLASAA